LISIKGAPLRIRSIRCYRAIIEALRPERCGAPQRTLGKSSRCRIERFNSSTRVHLAFS